MTHDAFFPTPQDRPSRLPAELWAFDHQVGWTRLEVDPLEDFCVRAHGGGDQVFRNAGYESAGPTHLPVVLYEAFTHTPISRKWRFVVEVSLAEVACHLILVANLPSLLELTPKLQLFLLPSAAVSA